MKTQCPKKIIWYSMVICLAAFSLVACQPKINGTIFLDDNGNQIIDPAEVRLGNVLYKVTIDGNYLLNGTSDFDGTYELKADKIGEYCIEIGSMDTPIVSTGLPPAATQSPVAAPDDQTTGDKSGINQHSVLVEAKSAAKKIGDDDDDGIADAKDNCSAIANKDQADKDSDGLGDVCDNDDDNDGITDAKDNCPTTANKDQVDKDDDGLGDVCENDKDNDNEPVKTEPITTTVGEGKSCVNLTSLSNVSLDVRIPKNYSGIQIPDIKFEAKAGEVFNLVFHYPQSCNKFAPFYLPKDIQVGEVWEPGADMNAVNLGVSGGTPIIVANTTYNITQDKIAEKRITLIANPQLTTDKEFIIEAVATCPDNTTIPLRRTIQVYGVFPIKVTARLRSTNFVMPVETITVEYQVENKSILDHNDIEFTAGIVGLMVERAEFTLDANNCDNLGSEAVCRFSLDSEGKKDLKVVFRGPEKISSGGETFEVKAKIRANDLVPAEEKDVADVVSFTIKPNPEDEEQQGDQQ